MHLCLGGWTTVASRAATTSHCSDDAIRVDPANPVIGWIRNVQITVGADGDSIGYAQPRLGGRAAVATTATEPIAGHAGDDAVRVDPANPVHRWVRDVEAPIWPHCHPSGGLE